MYFSTAVVAAFAALAAAVPTTPNKSPKPKTCPSVQRNANFDDLTVIPGSALTPVPTPYKGLFFQAFDTINVVQTGVLPGVIPHSGPNYAGSGVFSEVPAGTPMFTTNYQNSQIQSFSLQSFYYGCTTQLANGATALPSECNVQVTGYKGQDNTVSSAKQVCSQQFQYHPTTILGAQQQAFSGPVKSCFNDIQFAVITFTPPGGQAATSPLLALLVDDVKYSTKAKKC